MAICMPVVQWTLYLGYLCMVTISAVPSLCTLCTLYVSVRSFILDPRFHMRKNRSPGQKPTQYRRSEHTPATWWRRTMLTHTYKYSCWENKIYIPYINQNIYIDHFDFFALWYYLHDNEFSSWVFTFKFVCLIFLRDQWKAFTACH